eukprot:TRINITY_DN7657_c0_g3_i2.p1 TRINITY_DN7657_c0_g3~~TRINITY_DN7657_c0_g3_i2.p1  ORF type:complete len:610 (-),score=85.10 TRINITY_DN7657_c0_g3_i2:63-1892(-)
MEAGIRPRVSSKKSLSQTAPTNFFRAEDPFARREVKQQRPVEEEVEKVELDVKEEEEDGDHCWHYRYNRRLACFSHPVTNVTFTEDGRWCFSSMATGDIKVWDTTSWAENSKIKPPEKAPAKSIVMSPQQRWLVVCYAKTLQIYHCKPPWRLEQAIPSPADAATGEPSEWCCVAFSPCMAEVDNAKGWTGADYHLAAFSSQHFAVMDYSAGWSDDSVKGRSRSLLQSARPTSLAYTMDGFHLIVGFEIGQIQIWNTFSLTLERTLAAHSAFVSGIVSSPRAAPYDSRFVSCSVDQTLRVWHTRGWVLEQIVPDMKCDKAGVRMCTFSATGNWLISIGTDLCIWQVVHTNKGRVVVRIHQRLGAACGAEGIARAAISPCNDAVAVGSRDGILGLYMKHVGIPTENFDIPPKTPSGLVRPASKGIEPWSMERVLARPMRKITPDAHGSPDRLQSKVDWFQRAHMRSLTMTSLSAVARPLETVPRMSKSSSSPLGPALWAKEAASAPGAGSPPASPKTAARKDLKMRRTMPDLNRWRVASSTGLEYGDMMGWSSVAFSADGKTGKRLVSGSASSESATTEKISPIKKSILHACRGELLVQRISLDPKSITDD